MMLSDVCLSDVCMRECGRVGVRAKVWVRVRFRVRVRSYAARLVKAQIDQMRLTYLPSYVHWSKTVTKVIPTELLLVWCIR